ncbi:MAG: hypothetical protein ABIL47_07970 [candidate division WOR-3 bacterium]
MRWLILIIALLILLNVIYINDDIKKLKELLSKREAKREEQIQQKEEEIDFIEEV